MKVGARTGTLKRTAFLDSRIVTPTKFDEAKAALEDGKFDEALQLTELAHAEQPEDPQVRELYAVTHLAKAIRLSEKARQARQADLMRREIDYEQEFQDLPEVSRAFDEALNAIENVLRIDPTHWKARMLKAALVFRRDRETGRPEALAILHELAAADPTNKQVPFTIRKIERPCERCSDTGFCSHCKGRGLRKTLGFERKCETCYGRGICPACGVL
jgi:tetratricopeptide (TPR) repeat protein